MKIEIVDYKNSYANELNQIDIDQWGNLNEEDKVENFFTPNRIFKVALLNSTPIGFAHGKFFDDNSFEIEVICIHKNFQRLGIGTKLLKELLNIALKKKITKAFAYLVNAKNHTNAAKLVENFGFVHKHNIQSYWGLPDPEYYCPECEQKPCICIAEYWEKIF